jgi:hypothetical protein
VIDPAALRRRPAAIDRSSDRLVALGAIVVALLFLVSALASGLLPAATRLGLWLPLHLALAGGATTAIAGVMPFFVAAFAAAPPADPRLRTSAVVAVALGAAAVSVGVASGASALAAAGGTAFIGGVVLTGLASIRPLGRALGPGRGIITRGYVAALGEVAVGAAVSTLFVAGWAPVAEAWARIKPAHAWLNLAGFVSLVIATTLLHFFPTVIGTRIVARPSARFVVAGLAVGAPLVAVGIALASDVAARTGALVVGGGAAALAVYAAQAWRTRGRWTTDPGWHLAATGGLVSAILWFEVGMAVAAGRVLALGAAPDGWSIGAVAGPLVAGWMGLALVGSATHLLPAIGPGDPIAHAAQRALLGRAAVSRLAAGNAGVAALTAGLWTGLAPVATAGAIVTAGALGWSVALLVAAVRIGLGARRPKG